MKQKKSVIFKLGHVFPMVVVSILLCVEFGPNYSDQMTIAKKHSTLLTWTINAFSDTSHFKIYFWRLGKISDKCRDEWHLTTQIVQFFTPELPNLYSIIAF